MKSHDLLIAACDGIVKHYRDDLHKHDKAQLEANEESTPFLHFARECGTHLLMLIPDDGYPAQGARVPHLFGTSDREHLLAQVNPFVATCSRECATIHYWNGRTLRAVSADKAKDIAAEYVRGIYHRWHQQREERERERQLRYA